MTRINHSGGAVPASLATPMTSGGPATISLDNTAGWPTSNFYAVIGRGTVSEEKIFVSVRSGNTLTIGLRGADNTQAQSHAADSLVEHVFTALEADQANVHIEETDGVHGLSVGDNVAGAASVAAAETSARSYADAQDDSHSADDRAYTDGQVAAEATRSDAYADQAEADAKAYADAQDASHSADDRAYADAQDASHSADDRAYTDAEVATAQAAADAAQADFDASPLVQSGQVLIEFRNDNFKNVTVNFPIEFGDVPHVVACASDRNGASYLNCAVRFRTTTSVMIELRTQRDSAITDDENANWIAVGPRP